MTSAEERRQTPFSLHPLPAFLGDTRQNKLLYVVKAWLLIFVPSVVFSLLLSQVPNAPAGPEFGASGLTLLLLLAVFAPIAETLIMVPPLLLLDRLVGPRLAAVGSAILWGVLHSLASPLWGLIAWWPFLIFSAILLVWRRERGLLPAMVIVTAVHALQNGVVGSTLLLQ